MATLTVTPNPSVPSSTVNVHGAGFGGLQQIKLSDGSNIKTRADGTFDVPLLTPSTAGNYTVAALKGQTILAQGTFAVQTPTPPPPPAITAPGIPINFSLTPGDSFVTLVWGPPVSNGGGAILGYKVYRGGVFLSQLGVVTSYTNLGLSNGTPYSYAVSAFNSVGEGVKTATLTATPVNVVVPPPTLPVISSIVATPTGTSASVSWHVSVPAQGWVDYGTTTSYGGLFVTGGGQPKELSFNYQDHTQTVSGLSNSTLYHYRIHAVDQFVNEVLSSDQTFTTTGAAITFPGIPQNLTATPGGTQVSLGWNAPASNGGSPITNYKIYRNGSLLVTIGNVTTYTNTALAGSTTYSYAVSAVNSFGEGTKTANVTTTTTDTVTLYGALWTAPWNGVSDFNAGLREATLELELNRIFPTSIAVDPAGITWTRDYFNNMKNAGLKVVVELGFHHLPPWLLARTDLQMKSFDNTFGGTLDIVWNSNARAIIDTYFTAVFGGTNPPIPLSQVDGIRLAAAGGSEFFYPNSSKFWCAGAMNTSPYPNWTPGTATNALAIWNWYLDSLVAGTKLIADKLRALGYLKQFWATIPGKGSPPGLAAQQAAVGFTNNLDVLGRGADWNAIINRIAPFGWGIWCSSAIEYNIWDTSQPGDINLAITDAVWQTLSSHRWIAMLATKKGLQQSLENPGYGDTTGYGVGMMQGLVAQAKAIKAVWCAWAHDSNLYNSLGGVTLADWTAAIKG